MMKKMTHALAGLALAMGATIATAQTVTITYSSWLPKMMGTPQSQLLDRLPLRITPA